MEKNVTLTFTNLKWNKSALIDLLPLGQQNKMLAHSTTTLLKLHFIHFNSLMVNHIRAALIPKIIKMC